MSKSDLRDSTVLVVDDSPENLELMGGLLGDLYRVKVANSGSRALKILEGDLLPDLILLDVMMPDMSGWEVCQVIQSTKRLAHIAVIFLTAKTSPDDEKLGFDLGAVDYISKPINPATLLSRVKTHLSLKRMSDVLRDRNLVLKDEIEKGVQEIRAIQETTIHAMASLAETRDNETGNHIRRTQNYVKALAQTLSQHPRFSHYLTDEQIEMLYMSAPLHDIGKVGIPDHILLKPGRLDAAEFEIMKTHTTLGYQSILSAAEHLSTGSSFLTCAMEIALSHQEKWDGSGYPQGLSGDAIPISARLMAVADVYDALISERYYKKAFSHESAVGIILEGRGSHFDPDVVDAFQRIEGKFVAIATKFSDAVK
jgi:putative two-component system response regulator